MMITATPVSQRFHDAAFGAREQQSLLTLMKRICDARPAAREASARCAVARELIHSMQNYQAAMLNTCSASTTKEAKTYLETRPNGGDLQRAELAVLRMTGNKDLLDAFEDMLQAGGDFLNLQDQPAPRFLRLFTLSRH